MRTFSSTSSQGSIVLHQPQRGASPSITLTSAAAAAAKAIAASRHIRRTPSSSHNLKLKGATTSPESTTKCATVTMMLAERIIRNDWSVEDEHFFESNNMNVWQTLEFISSINSRKRYNYEGYNDAKNAISALTPSWRRDSFVEKNVNPNGDESNNGPNRKYSTVATGSGSQVHDNSDISNVGGVEGNAGLRGSSASRGGSGFGRRPSKYTKAGHRRRRNKKKLQTIELDPEYALSPSDYSDLIKCT